MTRFLCLQFTGGGITVFGIDELIWIGKDQLTFMQSVVMNRG